ncbi:hypothetical protein [Streptomyces sp. NPDC057340]|uniref:hypothetical protein n=1 Tax=Streptomyces sp. NPDC057340 TaxID=3346103 RepID=UPI00363BAA5A
MGLRVYGVVLQVVACGLAGWQVWFLWDLAAREAWPVHYPPCPVGELCGGDPLVDYTPFLGAGSMALFVALSWRFLHRAAVPASVLLAAVAGLYGVERTGTSDAAWSVLFAAVALAASLVTWWCAATGLRRNAVLRRWSRRYRVADARVVDWRRHGPGGFGAGLAVFRDEAGVRHRVPVVVERYALARHLVAVYDPARPADPRTTRVAAPRSLRPLDDGSPVNTAAAGEVRTS